MTTKKLAVDNREVAVKITDLHYAYQHNWTMLRKKFIAGLNLEVYAGEVFGFLGHNGAGKTTTIKCMTGLIKPKRGKIELFGVDVRQDQSRANLGFLPEQPYFYDNIRVGELMTFLATLKGIDKSKQKQEIGHKLERVGMQEFAKKSLRNLSKGQVQRIGLAQAMLGNPKLYIMDEPFSGLDPVGRREFADIFFQLKQEGATMLVSTHILNDIEALCDRASIMVRGEIKGIYNLSDLPKLLSGKYQITLLNEPGLALDKETLAAVTGQEVKGNRLILTFAEKDKAYQTLQNFLNNKISILDFKFSHGGLEELFIKLQK